MSAIAEFWDRLPRPLDPFASFKVKTGLLVGGAILLASFTFWIGASWQFRYALLAALATSLILTQFLAHGMTSPLRQMTAAARPWPAGTTACGFVLPHATKSANWQRHSIRWRPTSVRPTNTDAG